MESEIIVTGVVQGVGFRPFVYRIAVENDLKGYVQNRADAGVKIVIQGGRDRIKKFISDLKEKKPPLSRIYDLKIKHNNTSSTFTQFEIYKSSQESELQGSVIPADAAMCDDCLRELRNPNDRRFDYFFITCTNCGPRYTSILDVPYDRPTTTMQEFPMCRTCEKEYQNPLDRRFHAQTIACHDCGPKVFLSDGKKKIESRDPIREAGKLIEEGSILALKGNGGFHIASSTIKSEPIIRLRTKKYRGNKPFSIMSKDLESVQSFASVTDYEKKILTSHIKPIVLLAKNEKYDLSDLVSPGLDSIGTMLPYTGMHEMLFDKVSEPAFVMTSANPPNEPIVIDNEDAQRKLGEFVDYFLFHDRKIAQRADDSVIRLHNDKQSIIRRSRGFAPEPINFTCSCKIENPSETCVLGLGAELNLTSCLVIKDKAFLSQHIGDVDKYETLEFLRDATEHLIRVTNANVSAVACDMHPHFNTTKLAYEFAHTLGVPVIQVQHHHAHIASLMGEHGIDEMIGIACDGYGYGLNGSAWGGEVLYCSERNFKRLGNLMPQPMIGGDLATKYPLRMVAGMLADLNGINDWLYKRQEYFPHGKKEVDVVFGLAHDRNVTHTTSCGRVLDAVSALLDVCYLRTYEGEPAMKLESLSSHGKDVLSLEPRIVNNVIDTKYLLKTLFENLDNYSIKDLAFSAHSYLGKSFARLAMIHARQKKVNTIGFSGGVAHNELITNTIRQSVEESGFTFQVHNKIPPGDGGISFGQTVVSSLALNNHGLIQDIQRINKNNNIVTNLKINYR
ncbi:MAG: carbamoyltransferase HypF [Thaumarchaeota archaeon]|nr:MAG: carbamoyltransferase HypF [Nitrososphaerota archaeon]